MTSIHPDCLPLLFTVFIWLLPKTLPLNVYFITISQVRDPVVPFPKHVKSCESLGMLLKYKILTGFSLGCRESIGLGRSPGCSIKMQMHQRRYENLGSCFIHFICLYLPLSENCRLLATEQPKRNCQLSSAPNVIPSCQSLGNHGYTVPSPPHPTPAW